MNVKIVQLRLYSDDGTTAAPILAGIRISRNQKMVLSIFNADSELKIYRTAEANGASPRKAWILTAVSEPILRVFSDGISAWETPSSEHSLR